MKIFGINRFNIQNIVHYLFINTGDNSTANPCYKVWAFNYRYSPRYVDRSTRYVQQQDTLHLSIQKQVQDCSPFMINAWFYNYDVTSHIAREPISDGGGQISPNSASFVLVCQYERGEQSRDQSPLCSFTSAANKTSPRYLARLEKLHPPFEILASLDVIGSQLKAHLESLNMVVL